MKFTEGEYHHQSYSYVNHENYNNYYPGVHQLNSGIYAVGLTNVFMISFKDHSTEGN